MISGKVAAISGTILLTTTISWAQQNFPLRPGEWESTTSFSDRRSLLKQRLCLNDRKWTEVIVQADVGSPPACNGDALATEKGLNGGGYCHYLHQTAYKELGKNFPLEDVYNDSFTFEISFDGMTHMIGKETFLEKKTFTPLEYSQELSSSLGPIYKQAGPDQTLIVQSTVLQLDFRWKRDACGRKSKKFKTEVK